jgi:acetolactate synthase-1/2/3 large subunit
VNTGADSIVEAFSTAGVRVCFANPGTSEVHLVRALDAHASIRACLALHENVATGAADGYGRMAGKPALALLHLLPGLANGLANLHNARRARSPVVAVVGQQATWHVAADSPITGDVAALASVLSTWVRESTSTSTAGRDASDAVAAALGPPGGVATLIVPVDVQRAETAVEPADAGCISRPSSPPDGDGIEAAARLLLEGRRSALYLGGSGLDAQGLCLAARIAAATGCQVFAASHFARMDRGGGVPYFPTIPYFPEQARPALEGLTGLVVSGASRPVYMFGSVDGQSSPVPDGCAVVDIGRGDAVQALEAVASVLGPLPALRSESNEPGGSAASPLDVSSAGSTVARALPPDSIVVDESGTSGTGYHAQAPFAVAHTCLGLTGGAIGMGLPVAIGAAVACPDRRVVSLQADGSTMYTVQALWTMAREGLDVTVVLLSNRSYGILSLEFARAGLDPLGPVASSLIDLSNPVLDWVHLAEGHGVPATRATTVDRLETSLRRSFETSGPMLIEVQL